MRDAEALRGLMALIDDGLLIRNTANDGHFPNYLSESTRLVTALAAAQEALAAPPPQPEPAPHVMLDAISLEHQRDHDDGPALPREGCNGCKLIEFAHQQWNRANSLDALIRQIEVAASVVPHTDAAVEALAAIRRDIRTWQTHPHYGADWLISRVRDHTDSALARREEIP